MRHAQRPARAQQMSLAHHLVQAAWAKPFGQRQRAGIGNGVCLCCGRVAEVKQRGLRRAACRVVRGWRRCHPAIVARPAGAAKRAFVLKDRVAGLGAAISARCAAHSARKLTPLRSRAENAVLRLRLKGHHRYEHRSRPFE